MTLWMVHPISITTFAWGRSSVIYHKITTGRGSLEDCLQKGRQVVAAGYLLYGTSTMLVYSTGRGVNGFTLDPAVGEFLLSHPAIRIPEPPSYYSVNQGNQKYWSRGVQEYTAWLQGQKPGVSRALGPLCWFPGGGFSPKSAGRRSVLLPGRYPGSRKTAWEAASFI